MHISKIYGMGLTGNFNISAQPQSEAIFVSPLVKKVLTKVLFEHLWLKEDDVRKKSLLSVAIKVSKAAKIRKQYDQVQHLTQDTSEKVTSSQ